MSVNFFFFFTNLSLERKQSLTTLMWWILHKTLSSEKNSFVLLDFIFLIATFFCSNMPKYTLPWPPSPIFLVSSKLLVASLISPILYTTGRSASNAVTPSMGQILWAELFSFSKVDLQFASLLLVYLWCTSRGTVGYVMNLVSRLG